MFTTRLDDVWDPQSGQSSCLLEEPDTAWAEPLMVSATQGGGISITITDGVGLVSSWQDVYQEWRLGPTSAKGGGGMRGSAENRVAVVYWQPGSHEPHKVLQSWGAPSTALHPCANQVFCTGPPLEA